MNLTTYQYAANNPIRYIDVNGDSIRAHQTDAQEMITNTLNKGDTKYVRFDKSGGINLKLLNSHKSKSANYNSLLELANSQTNVDVSLDDHFDYVNENGVVGSSKMSYQPAGTMDPDVNGETIGGTTTGEAGLMGKTLFPDLKGKQNSPDETLRIVVNKNLSEAGRAENYSHEANEVSKAEILKTIKSFLNNNVVYVNQNILSKYFDLKLFITKASCFA